MHGKDAARNKFPMLADAEMPRLYPHHVIKHELQVEPPFHTHLGRQGTGSGTGCHSFPQSRSPRNPLLEHSHSGLPLHLGSLSRSHTHEPKMHRLVGL